MPLPGDPLADASAAARAAGVEVRELSSIEELQAAAGLFGLVWGRPESPPVTMELLRALSKAGNYVAGTFEDGRLVGAAAAFFEAPASRSMHSHIGAVVPDAAGRGAGRALKLHQRVWALERDVTTIAWTFDPLIRRNAYFNLVKLGARPVEYLRDFYGDMTDLINAGDRSDRLLVHWELLDADVAAAARGTYRTASAEAERHAGATVALDIGESGEPVPRDQGTVGRVLVAVPPDVEGLRRSDPGLAGAWRLALRDVLSASLAAGGRVTGFDPAGWYVLDLPPGTEGEAAS